jgi:glutamine amidotransferase
MCMLCVIPPNVIPSRQKLENSALNNPHGFGFAIVIPSENRIHVERTMNADTSINRFLDMRGKYPEGYAMWHARYATHGSMTVDNCHPFQVGVGNNLTYLAHNGILPIIEPKGDDRSDTRIFAEDLLPAIGGVTALDNPQVSNLIEDFTGGSKVCILTVDPRAEYQCYLYHSEKGSKDESGVWWSNDSCYLDTYTRGSWKSVNPLDFGLSESSPKTGGLDFAVCTVCETYTDTNMLEWDESFCVTCGSCYECESYITNCMCYQGSEKTWANWGAEGGWALS